jgi:polyketide synthase PksJ
MLSLVTALKKSTSHSRAGIHFVLPEGAEEFISYQELYQKALLVLGALQQKGIAAGDELIIQLEDNRSFLYLFWGCILGNIIPVPVSPGIQYDQKLKLFRIWQCLNNPFLVCEEEQLKRLATVADASENIRGFEQVIQRALSLTGILSGDKPGIEATIESSAIAYVQFSSGSTGHPKGVCLTHDNLLFNIADIIESLAITPSDKLLSWMPLTHDMGMIGFHLTGVVQGIDQVCMPTASFIRRPLNWMEKAAAARASVLYSPNFGLQYFMSAFQKAGPMPIDLAGVRIIVNGAEPISVALCKQFVDSLQPLGLRKNVFVAAYGLAEASVEVAATPVHTELQSYCLNRRRLNLGDILEITDEHSGEGVVFADVGFPISHCGLRICDGQDNPLPENTIGHIQITGKNVTRGYYNNPEATASLFTNDHWLRTGDLGFIRNGRLVVTGRAKNMIIINGQNYYPQDFERTIHNTGTVEPGKVVVCGTGLQKNTREELLVFILYKGQPATFRPLVKTIRDAILKQMNIWVDQVIPVKKIPKTTSGKIQHFQLVEQYLDGEFNQSILALAQNELADAAATSVQTTKISEWLLRACKELPGLEHLTAADNLFSAGMDSLLAMQWVAKIKQYINIDLSVETVFNYQTITELGNYLSSQPAMINEHPQLNPPGHGYIVPVPEQTHYPVSPAQRRLWILHQIDRQSAAYNESAIYEITGELDPAILKRAWESIVSRHEILRTNFREVDDMPVQYVNESTDHALSFRFEDLSNGNPLTPKEVSSRLTPILRQPFDLAGEPLYRIVVMKLAANKHWLTIIMHHIITDEWSGKILIHELKTLYKAFASGVSDPLPTPGIRYIDYVNWKHEKLLQENWQQDRLYWLQQLSGELPLLLLPADHPRPAIKKSEGDAISFKIPANLLRDLRQCCREEHLSLFMMLLAGVYTLLSKYAGQNDLVVGVPIAGREHPDTHNLPGFFVNLLPLRLTLEDSDTVMDLLQKIKRVCFDGYRHGQYPFDELVNELPLKRDLSRSPLFDVLVTHTDNKTTTAQETLAGDNIRFQKIEGSAVNSKYDLSFYFEERPDALTGRIEYDTHLFSPARIEKMGAHLQNLLLLFTTEKNTRLAVLDYLDSEEKKVLLQTFNPRPVAHGEDTIIDMFRRQAMAHPLATGIICEGRSLSYGEINQRSDEVAHYLQTHCGVGRNQLVALLLHRSEQVVIAVLGTWKAGATYIPIDTGLPQERISFILKNTKAAVLITNHHEAGRCEALQQEDNALQHYVVIEATPSQKPGITYSVTEAAKLAYIMYTSGSTGVPKGVGVFHHSVVNILKGLQQEPGITKQDRYLAISTYTFDISVAELFLPLVSGAQLLIASREEVLSGQQLIKVFETLNPTIMQATPGWWNILIDSGWQGHTQLKAITCGEPLSEDLKIKLLERVGSLWNLYGPTETTIFSSGKQIHSPGERVTIGSPVINTRIYILDAHRQLVPQGVYGELYIGGQGVASGYLGLLEMTNEKFVSGICQDPGLCYRTGDIGRWLPDGSIELTGRADHQLKLRGFRMEPGEIEAAILQFQPIQAAAVVLKQDGQGDQQLVAYIVLQQHQTGWEHSLRVHLQNKLPAYMVPAWFIVLPSLPVTSNGKVDRKFLSTTHTGEIAWQRHEYQPPTTRIEKKLLTIWELVLDREGIGVTDNFFNVGGHSLKANRLVNKIFQEWGVTIKLSDIFVYATIRRQSELITALEEDAYTYIEFN